MGIFSYLALPARLYTSRVLHG